MYIHEETMAGDTIIVRNHYTSRYKKKGLARAPNRNKTNESQVAANIRKDAWELTIRMNANFTESDHHIQLTYRKDERPADAAAAKEDRRQFLRRLRALYRRHEKELRFIILTGYSKTGVPHHHMVLSGEVPISEVAAVWKKGRLHATPLDASREYSKLAAYFANHRQNWKKHDGSGRMWTCSKNLYRPPTKKRIIRANRYYEKPQARKGYYVTEETYGITRDGWPYMNYILVRDKKTYGRSP